MFLLLVVVVGKQGRRRMTHLSFPSPLLFSLFPLFPFFRLKFGIITDLTLCQLLTGVVPQLRGMCVVYHKICRLFFFTSSFPSLLSPFSLAFNPVEHTTLASTGIDRNIALYDIRGLLLVGVIVDDRFQSYHPLLLSPRPHRHQKGYFEDEM